MFSCGRNLKNLECIHTSTWKLDNTEHKSGVQSALQLVTTGSRCRLVFSKTLFLMRVVAELEPKQDDIGQETGYTLDWSPTYHRKGRQDANRKPIFIHVISWLSGGHANHCATMQPRMRLQTNVRTFWTTKNTILQMPFHIWPYEWLNLCGSHLTDVSRPLCFDSSFQ